MRHDSRSISPTIAWTLGVISATSLVFVALAPRLAYADSCKAPRVLVILDKSSSMLGDAGGQTKWDVAKTALDTLLKTYDTSADFGLMLFPSPSQCGPGKVVVNIGTNTATSILAQLASPPPAKGNWTPMAQSLDVAPQAVGLQDTSYPRHVLLITDGWQWCSPYQNASRFLPVNSVTQLKQLGITTHVVGFGASVDALTLNKMAEAAGTQRTPTCDPTGNDASAPNPCYYQANNVTELSAALDAIAKKITQEVCDGEDNDCNGSVDDGLTGSLCPQQQGVCAGTRRTCEGSAGWASVCAATDYAANATSNGKTYEQNETLCDGQDNDCDGTTDEGCACQDGQTRPCGSDEGICQAGTQRCVSGTWTACEGDIPPVAELCDGKDNDCDGQVDENLTRQCTSACGTGIETCTKGKYTACTAPKPSTEICDGIDNDCNGTVDGPDAICENGGTCIDGRCQQEEVTVGAGGAGGCDCRVGDPDGALATSLPLSLLLLAFVLLRRRSR